ncbi:radical SAM protein [Candidatus Parcubacteria bacterium]|nr:radical SAM protein [Patescibacteria group bacterium]MBU4308961.1 radical SAM protein [Patescibacteria group bacterium]MBU4431869.1 radical SAM protein [Patescibacteria group bacterium]MBU4577321.1 radical SAM protein [Patescibacteria group bacterium]MCG2697009.1 radical SAM protein [Candidatus Parcubacteria bacterium]
MKKSILKPVDAVIAITYQCNSQCIMCGIWKKKEMPAMQAEDFLALPKSLVDLNISGGEPFLRADLPDFVSKAKECCSDVNIIISTNGFATALIVTQMEKILKIDPEIGVAVSIDGLEEVHNQVRRIENGFNKSMATIAELKKMGVKKIKIGFTIADYNYQELRKVYELSRELGVELSLSLVHSSENFFSQENKVDKKNEIIEQLEWLIGEELKTWNPKKWARAYYTYGMIQYIKTGKRILPDYSGQSSIFIDPNCDVYPSDISSNKIGTIKNKFIISAPATVTEGWMICTARPAIKKHWARAIFWILRNKFYSFVIPAKAGIQAPQMMDV